eukprot:CAMPEP_0181301956 /NCGR_PEP_ID=MMETSP1101-20121128/7706_1 /TAXON_ID=46948 /ORGANISM="Rhodomonas abbreviata, Strain Caron Lab Isolate" /LENGTH=751 /DNA_ID=CAMNT_0023407307 /DNA_START=32 /DNA_END=2287 /DNA_ORIENTATION=+
MALFAVVGLVLSSMDLALWCITFGPLKYILSFLNPRAKVLAVTDAPDAPRRRIESVQEMHASPFPEDRVDTLFNMMQRSVSMFANRPCFGTRQLLGEKPKDPKKGQRFNPKWFGDTNWMTYGQAGDRLKDFGAGLRALGMTPQPDPTTYSNFDDIKGEFCLTIYENTCADWLLTAHACFSQSLVVSTVYATLGIDAVKDAVNEGNAIALLCNRVNVSKVGEMKAQMPSLKYVIYTDDGVYPEHKTSRPTANGLTVFSVQEVCDKGCEKPVPPSPPKPQSMAVIMYTSGSTGKPKGVLITHKALLGMCSGVVRHFDKAVVAGQELYSAFLPLAHIFELAAENSMLAIGAAIGYCDPRTLTISGAEPRGALEEFKPTFIAAVPKIWDIIKKGAEEKARAGSPLAAFLFQYAVASKIAAMQRGTDTPLFNALVFSKIKKVTGGRVKVAISGGGPLDKEVQQFISATICPILQGYGLTETCGGGTCQYPGDVRTGVVGPPLHSTEIKLVDAVTEDGTGPIMDNAGVPYKTTDTLNVNGEPCKGRGEILIGGHVVTTAYYRRPKETSEAYVQGGFFATGDIGEWTPDGCIKIVDRKKNLVKLKGGEYVALENMEMKFNNSSFVDAMAGGIMVYAGGDVDRPSAFVQCSVKAITKWAEGEGVTGSFEELLANPKARKAVLDDLNKHGKNGGLGDLEKLCNVTLLDGKMGEGKDAWTPANGGLTATNKIQRKNAEKLLGKEVIEKGKVDARTDWMKKL